MQEKKWYVIRCSSGQEKKAKKHIEAVFIRQNLNDYVSRMVIPTRKEVYVKNGKKINREVNYYPGYVLIETDMNPEIQHVILETSGVISILSEKDKDGKDKVQPLRNEEVVRILGRIDALTESSELAKSDFVVGESVVISDGPFANFNGCVEEINSDKKRLKVSIKIFGRKTPVELDYSQIIKN